MAWYKDWFNSKYYHLLYKNRDHNEAALFLDNISNEFKNKNAKILDVACGKGRHAKYLNNLGFDVTGIDLSVNSIKYAKEYENQKLKFHQHDMRNIFDKNNFDIVTNLFTSFGYFDDILDDQKEINSISNRLKNKEFIDKAPKKVVEENKIKIEDMMQNKERLSSSKELIKRLIK